MARRQPRRRELRRRAARRATAGRRPTTEQKNAALAAAATLLEERSALILEANAADLADERAADLTDALRDRLTLTDGRIDAMAAGVRAIAALPDPIGEELERRTLDSGLDCARCGCRWASSRSIYEARPNVTVDCAALTIKSGNAIVLRGSSYAERSNGALAAIMREARRRRPGCPRTRCCC